MPILQSADFSTLSQCCVELREYFINTIGGMCRIEGPNTCLKDEIPQTN